MKKVKDMHMNVKLEIKTTSQRCEKSFEEIARRIDLHDTTLNNIEVQMRQFTQAVQAKNNVAFEGEKGSNSNGKGQCLDIQTWKKEQVENCVRYIEEVEEKIECRMKSQEKEDVQLLESQKEAKFMERELSVKGKSNEQVLREIQWKVWTVVEQMSEEPKFMEVGFNLTNYQAFKQAMELKE